MDIRDLARHLNVSISTVSRALAGRSGVGAETRERILKAAARFNYSPNLSGRNLRKGRTHAIAFMFQPHPGDHQYGEPIFMPFLRGLQIGLTRHACELISVMDDPGDDLDRLRRIVESRWVDAIVLAWTHRRDPRIEYLAKVGFPFATFGRSESGGKSYAAIDFDFVRAGRDSVTRLAGLGHRRVATVTPTPSLNFAHLFRQGYREAIKRHGLVVDPAFVAIGEVNEQGGYSATEQLMRGPNRPTAIIYNNDAMALGGYKALADLSLSPGRDVAVMVVVSTAFSDYLSPALTGFTINPEAVGERLADLLMMSIPQHAGPDGPRILREVWPLTLIGRESDQPPRVNGSADDARQPPGRRRSLRVV